MTLSPGDRLDLKKKIAAALSSQQWGDIDMTLSEFGLPTVDEWEGDKDHYVRTMLRTSTKDEVLELLDSYLEPADTPANPPPVPVFEDSTSPWTGDRFRLFISHAHDNAAHAGALRTELAKRSIDAFVAHDSIAPTEEWVQVIEYALRTCDACLAILAAGFKESDWTDQELGFCIARNVLVIPLELGLMPYGFLGRYQALPTLGRLETELSLAIFELLSQKEQSRAAMARALVARWADSDSFDTARGNYALLKKVPAEAWTQPLVDRAWEAREQNPQLLGASINYATSEQALETLFASVPFARPGL